MSRGSTARAQSRHAQPRVHYLQLLRCDSGTLLRLAKRNLAKQCYHLVCWHQWCAHLRCFVCFLMLHFTLHVRQLGLECRRISMGFKTLSAHLQLRSQLAFLATRGLQRQQA